MAGSCLRMSLERRQTALAARGGTPEPERRVQRRAAKPQPA